MRRYARKVLNPNAVAELEAKLDRGRSKYGNKRTNGYASKREAKRAQELRLMEQAGEITGLREQVSYQLIEPQYIDGECVERGCKYVADFVYHEKIPPNPLSGTVFMHEVVEDAKGFRDNVYRLKRKLMLKVHGIRIREV